MNCSICGASIESGWVTIKADGKPDIENIVCRDCDDMREVYEEQYLPNVDNPFSFKDWVLSHLKLIRVLPHLDIDKID